MDGKVMIFREHDEEQRPTGRTVEFTGIKFHPLQYSDLINKNLDSAIDIPLNWTNAKVLNSNFPEIAVDKYASGNAALESIYTSKAIALVQGGWLPFGLAAQDGMIVLPDRCIVSQLKGRFKGGVKTNQDDKDFLDFFLDSGVRINPLFYVIEGNLRRIPSPDVMEQQLEEVVTNLRLALPGVDLVAIDGAALKGAVGIVSDTNSKIEREQRFLMKLAPLLRAPTSSNKKDLLWDEILMSAEECGVPKISLVVIAALSSISISNGRSPAKLMLKLDGKKTKKQNSDKKVNFTMDDAYNAVADIRSLEILISLFALFPEQRLTFCTGDKNLALFWAGIRASRFVWIDNQLNFKLTPDELLPGMTSAQRDSIFDNDQ